MLSVVFYILIFILAAILLRIASHYYSAYKNICQGDECLSSEGVLNSDVRIKKSYIDGNIGVKNRYRIKYYISFVIALMPLFLVGALRYGIGTDYFFTYVPQFINILNGGESAYNEYGFYWLNKCIQIFTDNPQWLFVVTSFIFVFFLNCTIIHCSVNVTFSIAVLFCSSLYFWSLNNVRQSIAAILIFAAFPHLLKRHTVRYLIYVAIATVTFHITALGMIIPYIIIHNNFVRKNFLPIIVFFVIVLPILCDVAIRLISISPYAYFLSDSKFNTGDAMNIKTLLNLFIFITAMIIAYKYAKRNIYVHSLLVMQYFAFIMVAVTYFIGIPEMLNRLMFYFSAYQMLLIPYCVRIMRKVVTRRNTSILYVFGVGAYSIYLTYLGDHEVIPYRWIFGVDR